MASYIEFEKIPTRKDETWKYTSLKDAFTKKMRVMNASVATSVGPVADQADQVLDMQAWVGPKVVFINGVLNQALSSAAEVEISYRSALAQLPSSRSAQFLETTLAHSPAQAVVISINKSLNQPLLVMNVFETSGGDEISVAISNLDIVVADNVCASVVYGFQVTGDVKKISSIVGIREAIGARATYESLVVRGPHCNGRLFIRQVAEQMVESRASWNTFVMGGPLTRLELEVKSRGRHTESHLNGLYLLKQKEHADFYTLLEHFSEEQTSDQVYRGVLDDQSVGVFRGKIHIHENCPSTATSQLNQNILLSKGAEINTLPQLQIDTDDVKATHGATVGQLQEEELFYLQSRAIDRETAKRMVLGGFAYEMVDKIKTPAVRSVAQQCVAQWLKQG